MSRVIHFEVPTQDPERAMRFYSETLGWTFAKWDGPMQYWTVTTGSPAAPGINGGLIVRPGGVVNTCEVDDVDLKAAAVEKAGGKIVVPKMAIPGVGWLLYCTDLDGNIFGMMQSDPAAK
jgi:hypothetical protein